MVADGGILDLDDCVTDVIDDREQVRFITEKECVLGWGSKTVAIFLRICNL